jgi:two-component system, OmpR family, sensor histidine kinase BaeS
MRATTTLSHRVSTTRLSALSPDSLRVQLAVGSALVALGAIALVTILSLMGTNLAILTNQRAAVSDEAAHIAQALGQGSTALAGLSAQSSGATSTAGQAGGILETTSVVVPYLVWIMDRQGHLAVLTPIAGASSNPQDIAAIRAALAAALSGQTHEDLLPSSPSWLSGLVSSGSVRWYDVLPIHAGGASAGAITGAVAVSMPAFSGEVVVSGAASSPGPALLSGPEAGTWLILVAALLTALLAVGVAIVFARRLTGPLEHLAAATHALRAGNYATRVHARGPGEIQEVMDTFNVMAATLEADVRQLKDQDRQRRELLAVVAHDLATPLTMIQGYTEALADGTVHDPAQRQAATRVIGREAARLRRLVNQLRQIALVEAGIPGVVLRPLELGAIVEDTLTALAPACAEKRLAIQIEGVHDLPPVMADRDWMAEILVNLAENAFRYTPQDGQITVSGACDCQGVYLRLADTGPGIPRADRERIFERFTRLDAARNSSTGGSGLGLAIVKVLVEAQGGTIQVEDPPAGTGACFALRFPPAPASTQ